MISLFSVVHTLGMSLGASGVVQERTFKNTLIVGKLNTFYIFITLHSELLYTFPYLLVFDLVILFDLVSEVGNNMSRFGFLACRLHQALFEHRPATGKLSCPAPPQAST